MGKKLIAIYPILYRARQYGVGEELPTQEAGMVEAWIKAKTAEWRGTEKQPEQPEQPKQQAEQPEQPEPAAEQPEQPEPAAEQPEQTAEQPEQTAQAAEQPEPVEQPTVTVMPATAVAGMEGMSTNGEEGALVGRIPKTPEREKAKPVVRTAKGRSTKATPAKKK